MALGLQDEIYGQQVLYRKGNVAYRASDASRLLIDAGAASMACATRFYSLGRQAWFRRGTVDQEPLPTATRFVFGSGLPTTVGYDFSGPWRQSDPSPIQADGDGGDSAWMNEAPSGWTGDTGCDMRALPGVGHMDIVNDDQALQLLAASAHSAQKGAPACVNTQSVP